MTAALGIVCSTCHAVITREREVIVTFEQDRESVTVETLCPRHLWLVVEGDWSRDPFMHAIDDLLADLDQPEPRFGRADANLRCSVCADLDQEASLALAQSGDPANLCLPHLAQALRGHALAASSEVVARFIASGRALERELSELIRMADYRFRDEPRGAERDSWQRALARVAGAPGVSRLEATRRRGGRRAG